MARREGKEWPTIVPAIARARLARALRENLKRRKARVRASAETAKLPRLRGTAVDVRSR